MSQYIYIYIYIYIYTYYIHIVHILEALLGRAERPAQWPQLSVRPRSSLEETWREKPSVESAVESTNGISTMLSPNFYRFALKSTENVVSSPL